MECNHDPEKIVTAVHKIVTALYKIVTAVYIRSEALVLEGNL